jgi:hypothetical protein
MLRRVLIGGVVAAAYVTALETEPKVDPRVSGGEAFLAAVRSVRAVIARSTEVSAQRLRH